MGTRRKGRELALQALYQLEITSETSEESLGPLWENVDASAPTKEFARDLVRGVLERRVSIDRQIEAASQHWRLERLSRVDLTIIRIAVYELTGSPPLPVEIAVNEAVELARRFGTAESAAFVNGLLDEIADRLGLKRETKVAPNDG